MINPDTRVRYIDSNHLRVCFSYLIIRVESINENFGALKDFAHKYDLYGYTNGQLYCFEEMVEPHNALIDLVHTILEPLGLIQNRDFVLGYEKLSRGAKDEVSKSLDKDLPDLENCEWLGSVLQYEGNFVWSREFNDWKLYADWRQEVFPQTGDGYYIMLLTKYIEERYPDKKKFEPTFIEFRGSKVVFGIKNQSGVLCIGKDILVSIVKI